MKKSRILKINSGKIDKIYSLYLSNLKQTKNILISRVFFFLLRPKTNPDVEFCPFYMRKSAKFSEIKGSRRVETTNSDFLLPRSVIGLNAVT